MTVDTYLRRLLEDIAIAPAIDTTVRHDLLVDALAPLGEAADRHAGDIETHAYWLRVGTHQSGHDLAFAASVDEAVYLVGRVLDLPATTNDRDEPDGAPLPGGVEGYPVGGRNGQHRYDHDAEEMVA